MLNSLKIDDKRAYMLKAKIHLLLASIYLHENKDKEQTINTIHYQLEKVDEVQANIIDDRLHTALTYYKAFLRSHFYYKLKRDHYPSPQKRAQKFKTFEKSMKEIMHLLRECQTSLSDLDEKFEVERAKTIILQAKITIKCKQFDNQMLEKVEDAISVFSKHSLKRLEVTANYLYSKICLGYLTNYWMPLSYFYL